MTNNIISQKAYDNIVNVAKNIFGDYAVIPQVDTINEKLPFYNSIMFIAIILVGLASIILALLFKYILLSRNKFISVLRICGCTNNKVRHIFISEILLSSTVSFILATVFYFNFIVKKLKKYFAYIGDVYSFNNCLLLGLIYFICIYIVLNIMIIINIKKSPISQLKQGGI